jgi:hypothetical protein
MPRPVGGDECSEFKNWIGRTFLSCIAFSPRLVVDPGYRGKPRLAVKPRPAGGELHCLSESKLATLFVKEKNLTPLDWGVNL